MTTEASVKETMIKQASYRVVNSLIACCHEIDRTHVTLTHDSLAQRKYPQLKLLTFSLQNELLVIIFQLITFTIIELHKGVAFSRKDPPKQIVLSCRKTCNFSVHSSQHFGQFNLIRSCQKYVFC